jgi:Asp-tRNA(Asn)/Glu-tRNA(Gln) amidotransferase A subunit family amidase
MLLHNDPVRAFMPYPPVPVAHAAEGAPCGVLLIGPRGFDLSLIALAGG